MSAVFTREVAAQVVIILAVCAGGWMILIQPKVSELQELEATIVECQSNPIDEQSIARFADRMKPLRDRADEIEKRNELAGDFARLYALLRDHAARHGIRVQSLQPGGVIARAASTPVSVTQVDMTVEGRFDQVVDFLAAVDELDCFVRPSSLTVVPQLRDGERRVVARFGFEAIGFSLSGLTEASRAES